MESLEPDATRPSAQEEPAPAVEPATPPSKERAEALTKDSQGLTAPLVAELAEMRTQVSAQADRIAELARENGTLTERLAQAERDLDGRTLELEASRCVLDELRAGQVLNQARVIGRLTAELAAERAAKSALLACAESHSGEQPREPAVSLWRVWASWLLALLVLVVVVLLTIWAVSVLA